MAACSNSDGTSSSTLPVDGNEVRVTVPVNDCALLEGVTEEPGQDNNGNQRITTRSSQGIANNGNERRNIVRARDFSWQWGQFIDHDISLTGGSADEPQYIPVPIGAIF